MLEFAPRCSPTRQVVPLALGLAVLGALVGFAAPAGAQAVPHFIETSHTVECGALEITLRNVSPWIYPVSVEIDGVHSYGPTVDNRVIIDGVRRLGGPQQDQSATRRIEFDEDSYGGEVLVRYRVQAGTERDLYIDRSTGLPLPVGQWTEVTVDTDCEAPWQEFDSCPGELGSVHATNLAANGWSVAGAGPGNYVDDALELSVPGGWQSTRITRDVNLPLAALGTIVDFDASPSQYVGLHLNIDGGGRLVYEQEPSYGGRWWLTPSSPDYLKDGIEAHPGAGGSLHDAEPQAWLGSFPDLVIESVEVLYTHPSASSTTLTSATFGCVEYTFGREALPAAPPAPTTPPTTSSGTETIEPELPEGGESEVGGIDDESDVGGTDAAAGDGSSGGTLPRTGGGAVALSLAAAFALGAGSMLRAASRRWVSDS